MKLIRPTYVLLAALTGPATIQAQTAATPAAAAPAAPAGTVAPTPAPRARVSPHETINASIGGRGGPRVTITYGRPYSKDPKTGEIRKIWGHLVKWDKADRLGADEATLLLTQKPLLFGTTEIPAGAYTLYIVPSEKGTSQLAFSSNLGNAANHSTRNLPILFAGGGFKHGQHLAFDGESAPPLSNLFVSMLQRLGIETDKFGSSTGTLTGLEPLA